MNHGSTFNEILISKEIVSKVGGFETTIRAAEELNLILKLATNNPNAKVVFQPETLMLKRVGNDSLAHKMRSQKEVPYLLLSLQTAAEYFLAHGTEESNQLKGYIFNRLYVTSTYAYRDGLWEYARKALEVWKQAQVPPPKLEPRYHHILHRVFGFFNAENILMAVRMLFSSHVSQS
jgi:hypothetical protein